MDGVQTALHRSQQGMYTDQALMSAQNQQGMYTGQALMSAQNQQGIYTGQQGMSGQNQQIAYTGQPGDVWTEQLCSDGELWCISVQS